MAAIAPALLATQVTFTGTQGLGAHHSGLGGAFTVKPDQSLSWVLDYYSPLARNVGGTDGTFQTFCIEKAETIAANRTFDVTLNTQSEMSGVPLTKGAAWLYYEFATGGLTGYDYATGNQAGALQNAFWWLMGEASNPANAFSQLVLAEMGSQAAMSANEDAFPVKVMNLWKPGFVGDQRYAAQDQLVLVGAAVPDPASTFLLMSLGFSMAIMARKCTRGC